MLDNSQVQTTLELGAYGTIRARSDERGVDSPPRCCDTVTPVTVCPVDLPPHRNACIQVKISFRLNLRESSERQLRPVIVISSHSVSCGLSSVNLHRTAVGQTGALTSRPVGGGVPSSYSSNS
ncbi:hypothetical protein T265_06570 [Opisthorchis viverrini]|uniref:Uncharacterized protein n=1 Tax=Opisthorchis viverrini TaxID=6198 RepID=A0A074ZRW7_OPIVI|nr:hypothetical protein T265_06570 [Opisthorchis viverrini]KER26090.1 hypothetical protein T265_06570 [Opisthorchis viverrini]